MNEKFFYDVKPILCLIGGMASIPMIHAMPLVAGSSALLFFASAGLIIMWRKNSHNHLKRF